MIRIFTVLLLSFLFISCGSTGQATESEEPNDEVEGSELAVDESLLPEWYSVGKLGEVMDDTLYGFAKSLGSDSDWAYENAKRQASVNLRIWVDNQIEEARAAVAEYDEDAAKREFILQLRNAISSLDFDETKIEREQIEDSETGLHVIVKIETPADKVLEEIEAKLPNYMGIWNQIKETAPLTEW